MKKRFIALFCVLCILMSSFPAFANEDAELQREEGCNLLTLYWQGNADIATSDIWIWLPGKDGKGYLFSECDYGWKVQMNVPEDVSEVGFIVRTKCSAPGGSSWGEATKDFADDRFAQITSSDTRVYLKSGDGKQYESDDGGKTLKEICVYKMAAMTGASEITYTVAPATRITSLNQITLRQGERVIPVSKISSLNNNVVMGRITTEEPLDITLPYTLEIEGYGTKPVIPTTIFDSKDFIENYTYDGDDLGAVVSENDTTFKLWAPTASAVTLNLYEAGNDCEAYKHVQMERGDKGVWSAFDDCGQGTYYTYTVVTALGTQETIDPYAKAAGVNGERGMVVDVSSLNPARFENDKQYADIDTYSDAVIWEVHVRDFSTANTASAYPGKYLAFTETGLTNEAGIPVGLDYVKDLGITHIHLQPVFDFASIDEAKEGGFNWGYDPMNHNVPEGSYSTDPYHGEVRITEFKQMVKAIHDSGMGVVMDVVYNHTYDSNSCLNKCVPYYYYRYTASGDNSNGSGCGNETASERAMMRKYIVDSVMWWAKEYHVDGFRFDLMALHDIDTMQAVEEELHAYNPKAIIYGEGWTGGTTPLSSQKSATQQNIRMIKVTEGAAGGVAVFDDAIRDGLKGSVFDSKDRGFISGNATTMNAWKVVHGMTGGNNNLSTSWRTEKNTVICYMSCHDNMTLFDVLSTSCPDKTKEALMSYQRLGAAAIMLSKGVPFMLAGEEMLRSKGGDSNSYMSGDSVNQIKWDSLTSDSDEYLMSRYYKQLIAIRKEKAYITDGNIACEVTGNNCIRVTWTMDDKTAAFALLNPNTFAQNAVLPDGEFSFVYGGKGSVSGNVTVPAGEWILVEIQNI